MSVVNSFLTLHKDRFDLTSRELMQFTMSLMKETIAIERGNTGSPGKAAIEYLLDTKYQIIENRYLEIGLRDQLLDEVDRIINKFVVKFRIKRKGKSFIFDESLEIASSDKDLLSQLYDLNTRLEVNKIQLARTPLGSSQSMNLTLQIKDIEQQIKDIKIAITKQKYFSHYDDQNSYNTMYRRSIGEKEEIGPKKSAAMGAAVGAVGKGLFDSAKVKKAEHLYDKRKKFQSAHKMKQFMGKEFTAAADDYDIAKKLAKPSSPKQHALNMKDPLLKKFYDKGGGVDVEKWKKVKEKTLDVCRDKANKYNKALADVTKAQAKSNRALLKGGAKGALIGAAVGLAAYGAHKYKQNHPHTIKGKKELQKLKESLDKQITKLKETNS